MQQASAPSPPKRASGPLAAAVSSAPAATPFAAPLPTAGAATVTPPPPPPPSKRPKPSKPDGAAAAVDPAAAPKPPEDYVPLGPAESKGKRTLYMRAEWPGVIFYRDVTFPSVARMLQAKGIWLSVKASPKAPKNIEEITQMLISKGMHELTEPRRRRTAHQEGGKANAAAREAARDAQNAAAPYAVAAAAGAASTPANARSAKN